MKFSHNAGLLVKRLQKMFTAAITWYRGLHVFLKRTLLGIAIFVAIVFCAGFLPLSFSLLNKQVETVCAKAFDGQCSIGKITLTPWLGVTLDSICIKKKESGMVAFVRVPRVHVSYYLVPLLFKCAVVKNIAIDKPDIEIDLPSSLVPAPVPAKPFTFEQINESLAGLPVSVVIRRISVDNGTIAVEQNGKPLLACMNTNVSMHIDLKKTIELSGHIAIKTVRLAGMWDVQDMRANYDVHDFVAKLDNCKAGFYGGRISLFGEADLLKNKLNKFTFDMSRVSLEKLYAGSHIGKGTCSGWLEATMALSPSALIPDSLCGHGHVKLSNVSIHDLPIQNCLLVFMAIPQIRNITFSKIASDLDVHHATVYTPDVLATGEPLSFKSSGIVTFNGYFSQKVVGAFSQGLVRSMPAFIAEALDEGENGSKTFRCTAYGTFDQPKVDIDDHIKRKVISGAEKAVGNVISNLGKSLGDFFRKK